MYSRSRASAGWPLAGERPCDEPRARRHRAGGSRDGRDGQQAPARYRAGAGRGRCHAGRRGVQRHHRRDHPVAHCSGHALTVGTRGVALSAGRRTIQGLAASCACLESTSARARRWRQWPGHHHFGEQSGHRQRPGERGCLGGQPAASHGAFPSLGLLTRCCWLSAWDPALPRCHRRYLTRAAPQRHFVAEHAPVITAHPEPDARCSG